MELRVVPVSDIIVGQRARSDNGNLLALYGSIQDVGLLHPLVVNRRMELISGGRRLAAVKKLKWAEVSVSIVDGLDDAFQALKAELDENTCREQLSPTEAGALAQKIREMEQERAKDRQRQGARAGGKGSGKLPEASKGDTRDKVAAAVGVSGKTLEKIEAVMKAAEEEPERFGDLPAQMDATGKVDPVHKELKRRKSGQPASDSKPKPRRKKEPGPAPTPDPLELVRQAFQQMASENRQVLICDLWTQLTPEERKVVRERLASLPD